jgi:hypothetical protein
MADEAKAEQELVAGQAVPQRPAASTQAALRRAQTVLLSAR